MKACTLGPFPGPPGGVWALSQLLVGRVGRVPVALSPGAAPFTQQFSLGWSWKTGWLWLPRSRDLDVLPERATRGPHRWPGSCQQEWCQRVTVMRERLSLGRKEGSAFLG